jgi:hypothetical protein
MLPLAAGAFPTSIDALVAAMQRGFEAHGVKPRKITGEGAEFPRLTNFSVDLTGAEITRASLPSTVEGPGAQKISTAYFELFGEPVSFEKMPLELRLEAHDVQAVVTGTPQSGNLKLESVAAGSITVRATIAALEGLLLSVVSEMAEKQGVTVKQVKLTFTQEGPRSAAFRAEVAAKVFIMSASLALTGRLDIDDAFNARISSLALDGDPMVTNLAGSFLRPRLQQLEGRVFPLLALAPGGLKLRDIQLSVSPDLQLQAQFGG